MTIFTSNRKAASDADIPHFEEIFKLHHRRVYSICMRMTGNTALAEDLTQDVFLQVFRKMQTFRGDSAFATWLHRLTVNQVLMHFRKSRVRRELVTEDGELPHERTSAANSNWTRVVDRIMLNEVITQLPRGYRTVFLMHDVEGLEHGEIAQTLGCSVGTSKSQLHKARIKLRNLLKRKADAGRPDQQIDLKLTGSLNTPAINL